LARVKEALRRIDMLDAILSVGAPIDDLSILLASGDRLIDPMVLEEPGLIVARAELQAALAAPLKDALHLGSEVVEVPGDPQAPSVRVGERRVEADLIIDASGLHSKIAEGFFGAQAYFRGAVGVVAIADAKTVNPLGCGVEYLGTGERAGLMPLPGDRSYWWFMVNSDDPSAKIGIDEITKRTRNWPEALKYAIANTSAADAHPVAVCARKKPSSLGKGSVICVGDAAHAMDPNQGQGACQAIEDAAVLAALAQKLPPRELLPAFEQARLARIRLIVGRSAFWSHAAHGSAIVQHLVRGLVRLTPPAAIERSMSLGP
jgi:2-polyprenyl-6-methoxyphenol hydroxylase-like FAD-dependent oxidoreductase